MKAIKSIQGLDPGNKITVIASNVITASSFFQRFLGLLAFRPLEGSEGLLIKDCKSIHTIGMRYNIDVIFIDSGGRVAAIFEDMAPFRFSPYIREACSVLELKAGSAGMASIRIGDIISFVE
ncbi:MAG: DUF192 domain-containing protein [Actinomycetota bacterium]|nr:MAG: DUF192 domain-containing protein [Actinomycetota bacterium]